MGRSPRKHSNVVEPCQLGECKNSFFQLARDAILIADTETGIVLDANRQAETLLGRPREDIVGMHQSALHPPEDGTRYRRLFAEHVAADGNFALDGEVVTGDGRRIPVEINSSLILTSDGRQLIQGIFRDVTERKRQQAELERYSTRLQALAELALAIGTCKTIEELVRFVAAETRQIVPATTAGLVAAWPTGEEVCVSATERGTRLEPAGAFAGRTHTSVRKRNRPLRQAPYKRAGRPPGGGWLGAPLVRSDQSSGGLLFLSGSVDGPFTDQDESIVVQLAQMTSVAVENLQSLANTARARAEMEALTRRLLGVQEAERRHLARELHDEIGQVLTGVKMSIGLAARGGEKGRRNLEIAGQTVHRALETVRNLARGLRPCMLDDLGLAPTLSWYFDTYREQTGIRVRFRHEGIEEARFGEAVETAAYRIVQESLTNIARHAQVRAATVKLTHADGQLSVTVEDRGAGFDLPEITRPGRSNGISGMRERTALLNGTLEVASRPGRGTSVVARIPATLTT